MTLVNGIAHPSDDETLTASGGSFKAVYNGDSIYTGSTGACEPLTATKKSSSTVTVIHAGKCETSYGYSAGRHRRQHLRHHVGDTNHVGDGRLDRP